jgi:DNA-binding NtrC family response regulator
LTVQLPPLRSRSEDVPALFSHFVLRYGGGSLLAASPALLERLCRYDWPYNVRELETVVRRLLLEHAHEPPLRSAHLPPHLMLSGSPEAATADAFARGHVRLLDALRSNAGNVARASSAAGMSEADAYRMMEVVDAK